MSKFRKPSIFPIPVTLPLHADELFLSKVKKETGGHREREREGRKESGQHGSNLIDQLRIR